MNVTWSPAFKSSRFEARKVNVLFLSSTLTIVPLNCFAAAELELLMEPEALELDDGEEAEGEELPLVEREPKPCTSDALEPTIAVTCSPCLNLETSDVRTVAVLFLSSTLTTVPMIFWALEEEEEALGLLCAVEELEP
jgi:EamA domain-containing membrane protein RarD